MNENVISKEKFNVWVDRTLDNCYKVTGITSTDVDNVLGSFLAKGLLSSEEFSDLYDTPYMKFGNFLIAMRNPDSFRITNITNGKSGCSKRNAGDFFDSEIALAVAWARYCKNPIPRVIHYFTKQEFLDLENGNVFYSISGRKFITIGIEPQTKDMMVVYREKDKNLKEIVTISYIENTYSFDKEVD